MPEMTYYRQKRRDGGLRSGIETQGPIDLGLLQEGKEDNPVLSWWVDVRASGRMVPRDAEAARQWFLDHGATIKAQLRELAAELRAGMDFNSWPLQHTLAASPQGVKLKVVCSVTRRLEARDASMILIEIADHWDDYLKELKAYEPSMP